MRIARVASPTENPACVTYRLKCSTIFSSRTCSGKFPTQRCLVSRTILRYAFPLHTHMILLFLIPAGRRSAWTKWTTIDSVNTLGLVACCSFSFSRCVPDPFTWTRVILDHVVHGRELRTPELGVRSVPDSKKTISSRGIKLLTVGKTCLHDSNFPTKQTRL